VRVFGIAPGSERTGYGCVETDGRRHRLVTCGAISTAGAPTLSARLATIHGQLATLLRDCRPSVVAIENLFHAANVRSALTLGHARGVAMLSVVEAGLELAEYTPAEIKRAVVGYGRAEKAQVQRMIALLLELDAPPTPHDAADALAVALCHVHQRPLGAAAALAVASRRVPGTLKSWRAYRPAAAAPPRRVRTRTDTGRR
jgi:crossover junction endodeoxyribonuclease RuvC